MKDIYVCSNCGGEDIESKMWVHINNGTIDYDISNFTEFEDNWCKDCQENTTIIEKHKFEYEEPTKAEEAGDAYMRKADEGHERDKDK